MNEETNINVKRQSKQKQNINMFSKNQINVASLKQYFLSVLSILLFHPLLFSWRSLTLITTVSSLLCFSAYFASKENLSVSLTNSDIVLSRNAFFFLTTSMHSLTALCLIKYFFVAWFCFSLLLKVILKFDFWTFDFTQCTTNNEIFRG